MAEPNATYERIAESPKGPIVAVVFNGLYPPGSAGSEFAKEMIRFFRSVLDETNAAAVLFDLTALDYVWGDTICGLAIPLLEKGKPYRPAAIVATGRTAGALKPLLEPAILLGFVGIRLFSTRHEAITHLEQAITEATG